jgi:cation diffusion facilitator family transporter
LDFCLASYLFGLALISNAILLLINKCCVFGGVQTVSYESGGWLEKGARAARISALVILVISILKAIIAVVSGSVALLAGTVNSFTAIFSSLTVWVGLSVAKKTPTERFPYGYYKAETLALLTVSLAIIASSIYILMTSLEKVFQPNEISYSEIALFITAISAVVYLILARHKASVGRQIRSQALISESLLSMVDVYASLLVFMGIMFTSFGYGIVEGFVGLAISAYALKRGLWFGKDAAVVLMDASPSPDRIRKIKEISQSVQGVRRAKQVKLRKAGPVFFGEMHAELEEALTIERIQTIIEEIESKVKEQFKDMESLLIHVEVTHKERIKVAVPVSEDKGFDSIVNFDFVNAPFFAFIELEKNQVVKFYVKVNEAAQMKDKKGLVITGLLIDEKVDMIFARNIFAGLFHVLRDNIIQIYQTPQEVTVKEAVSLFNNGLLKKMSPPNFQISAQ